MLKYWVWLAELPRLKGPFRLALLRHFGSPEDIFFADREELLLAEDVPPGQAELALNRDLSAADRILADCQRLGQRILTIQDAEYPQRLRNIFDPPLVLYVKGRMPVMDEEAAIAVVGTRECTPYGTACGERLGRELAASGAVVVTGLARGVDSAAARGALRAGGSVVGVTGGGLDVVYPPENGDLYADVAARGVLLSEYPPGSPPDKAHFPVRNRIMSGLSVAALVVEAPGHSGALITARLALEQGREVYAVPGPIDAPDSVGCNRLIRDGAGLAAEGWDILRDFQERFPEKLRPARKLPAWTPLPTRRRAEPRRKPEPAPEPEKAPALRAVSREGLTDDQIALLGVLEPEGPVQVDDLIESTGIPARRVSSALTMLEIDGCVRQHDGKRYTRTVALTE
ncbi:MAG: DNA-protecting protein DprA [Oscillibacter sp.]|jgi:DNA processing protein|uniref:DNA-processing protein DprA n=1 Tax=Oscillibacter sp. TaxID=1945593 RepID=UPI00216DA35B|nr:DNA-processing protein DprA [Oscillibacter sp.]MCI8841745.1 DNA-protecting protein DprA [Oscillibacter sp.]MCI9114202.1 DNA-protecting protein DprA [Oscillibacter sp.]MCI9300368.1 DNA-protecting protein DprA [Oscillibacter sp.]MCI9461434.1 DNA-protecting protein DprA [Oscillibacter sp.]